MDPSKITVHFKEGHISVVTYAIHPGFYWLDSRDHSGYGPFEYLSTALEHFRQTKKLQRPMLVVSKQNVVYVDFVAKKRVG